MEKRMENAMEAPGNLNGVYRYRNGMETEVVSGLIVV